MIEEAYDPAYGARPLKRFVEKIVGTKISKLLIGGELRDHSTVRVDYLDDQLKYEVNPHSGG